MSDETRSEPRISVYIYDRQGQFLGVEELSEEAFAALRQRLVPGTEPPEIRSGSPTETLTEAELGTSATYTYSSARPIDRPPPFRFEHDPAAGVFRLTKADGTVEVFRDKPVKYLCVEPDAETGAMRPATKLGRPVYLYLCREEREVR